MKITKKDLITLGQSLDAFYCGGNVYNHENITYYTSNKDIDKLKEYTKHDSDGVSQLIKYLQTLPTGSKKILIRHNLIVWSAGVYGNNGQIVKYDVLQEIEKDSNDYHKIDTFFTYYY